MNKNTPEQEADIKVRIEDFQKRFQELQEELKIETVAFPMYVPGPNGFTTVAQIMLQDTKYAPVPSPLSNSVIKEQ